MQCRACIHVPKWVLLCVVVLVTGACGFIGSQIVDLLLRNGYRVRGTVECLTNEIKIRPLRSLCPDSKYPLELVEADLHDHDSWDRLVLQCPSCSCVLSGLTFRKALDTFLNRFSILYDVTMAINKWPWWNVLFCLTPPVQMKRNVNKLSCPSHNALKQLQHKTSTN